MKNVLFFAGFLLFGFFGFAQQTYTLTGQVQQSGKPLPGTTVLVQGSDQGTLTDLDGNYQLKLQKGTYVIVFSYGNVKKIPLELTADQTLNVDLSKTSEALNEVFLSSVRVDDNSPIAHSNLSKSEINERNLGQDIPSLMNYLPSVVTTTDAGAGVGYSGIRIRGSDALRTNVTVNGVPMNDSESQGVFWVNLGDLASSVEDLQLQRGVGTSTNGAGAFGASINVLTDRYSEKAYAELSNSYGSYETHKHTAKFSTGLFNDHWEFAGRASLIQSDGYIDRASSELKSYFLQGTYVNDNTLIKALLFGGKERTYQAWYGIDGETLRNNRTYNPAGKYTDSEGNTQFYNDQTDNYQQDHFQLLWNQTFDEHWSSNVALHYTHGRGFYEEYQEDATLIEYGLPPFMINDTQVNTSDLVNTSWLDNHFYGTTFSLNYEDQIVDAVMGGGINRYTGGHYGQVIYTRFANQADKIPYEHYYDNNANKTDFNIYGKATISLSDDLAVYGDLQFRTIHYDTEGLLEEGVALGVDDAFEFFNPKAGITYQLNTKNQFYLSYGHAHREPTRTDYKNALFNDNELKAEKLHDLELGWRYKTSKTKLNANIYYMGYQDQLVLTGKIDDEGSAIRENSGKSYRLGLELDATFVLNKWLSLRPNLALSRNKNQDFTAFVEEEQRDFGDTDISFSPGIVAGNMIRVIPFEDFQVNFLSKFVGEQFMSNIEAKGSKLDSYFVSDLNLQYEWKTAPLFKEVVFTGLVNNIFNKKYVSNGYYDAGYVGYYPQATTNFLAGITLKF